MNCNESISLAEILFSGSKVNIFLKRSFILSGSFWAFCWRPGSSSRLETISKNGLVLVWMSFNGITATIPWNGSLCFDTSGSIGPGKDLCKKWTPDLLEHHYTFRKT